MVKGGTFQMMSNKKGVAAIGWAQDKTPAKLMREGLLRSGKIDGNALPKNVLAK